MKNRETKEYHIASALEFHRGGRHIQSVLFRGGRQRKNKQNKIKNKKQKQNLMSPRLNR